MARVFYLHWNKEEAIAAVRALRAEGHSVRFHADTGEEAWELLREVPPDVLVISLARLPSHGRRVAAVTTEYKKLRNLPLVFVDGAPEKVQTARAEFPGATFCTSAQLHPVLRKMFPATAPARPAAPAPEPESETLTAITGPPPAPLPEPKTAPATRPKAKPRPAPRAAPTAPAGAKPRSRR
jgi:CheY-like chemotaxis protein